MAHTDQDFGAINFRRQWRDGRRGGDGCFGRRPGRQGLLLEGIGNLELRRADNGDRSSPLAEVRKHERGAEQVPQFFRQRNCAGEVEEGRRQQDANDGQHGEKDQTDGSQTIFDHTSSRVPSV